MTINGRDVMGKFKSLVCKLTTTTKNFALLKCSLIVKSNVHIRRLWKHTQTSINGIKYEDSLNKQWCGLVYCFNHVIYNMCAFIFFLIVVVLVTFQYIFSLFIANTNNFGY